MSEAKKGFIALICISVPVVVMTIFVCYLCFSKEAVQKGHGHYDATTGKFTWNEPCNK
jgi:hypothetical protein